MNNWTPIKTPLGEIHGRDGIYIDDFKQLFNPPGLSIAGEISRAQCTNPVTNKNWIGYALKFEGVKAFSCTALDHYDDTNLVSSFDKVISSAWLDKLKINGCIHFVLSAYDYIYDIAADSYVFDLTGADRDE